MKVDGKWVEQNLGFDPLTVAQPKTSFARAEAASAKKPEDFQREIIDFDSEGPEGREFLAFSTATGLSRFTNIGWPKGLAPRTAAKITRKAVPRCRAPVCWSLPGPWTKAMRSAGC